MSNEKKVVVRSQHNPEDSQPQSTHVGCHINMIYADTASNLAQDGGTQTGYEYSSGANIFLCS